MPKKYPAKVLLFGEYTILAGSRALAVPIEKWYGQWQRAASPDHTLLELADYLDESALSERFDTESFRSDISKGLCFHSTIPQGYGLGSSAALTAAVYDNYVQSNPNGSLEDLRNDLALVESHYHGHSSGMDPLVVYRNAPILHENGGFSEVDIRDDAERPAMFLLNSGIGRFTAPLVALFKSRLAEPQYVEGVLNPLIKDVDHAIGYFLSGQWELFYQHLSLISAVEFDRFKEMLPEPIEFVWRQVRSSPNLCLKLCGAGGGGYFMGFARPGTDIEEELGVAVEVVDLK